MPKGTDKGVDMDEARPSRPAGLNYLLAIAINEYEHHPRLSNCVRDAEELVKVLQGKYGFPPDHTITLFDKEATAGNMYTRLVELSLKVKPEDNVVIYFSGHGFYDRSGRTGHLVPVEAPSGAVWHYFSNANLVNHIRAINSFHTFLVVDSCFSGSLFAGKDAGAAALAEKVEGLPSRWALAAGQIETVEDGLHGGHSPFAKALLSFLQTNNNPLVPASELIQHVKRVTPHNARQAPVGGVLFKTGDVGGEFVFRLRQDEAGAWAEAKRLNTLASYDDYLDAYPQGRYAEEAEERMEALDEENAWRQAIARGSLVSFRKYLRAYPAGKYAGEARQKIQGLKAAPGPELEPEEKSAAPKDMVLVEGGSFEMGDTFGDGSDDEKPAHTVTVSDFEIGRHEVTVEEFSRFVDASGYKTDAEKGDGSYVWDGKEWNKKAGIDWRHDAAGKLRPSGEYKHPVIHVSWNDAVAYCNWLSEQHGYQKVYTISGSTVAPDWNANGYRLPTEAEWEYAARQQGQKVRFGNGKDIADPGEINFAGSAEYKAPYSKEGAYRQKTTEVGSFAPNSLGLYDMSGNVWEWCWDWYDGEYYKKSKNSRDPKGPDSGSSRVCRGGSWLDDPAGVRVAYRNGGSPEYRHGNLGFRLARAVR